ncbi:MAG: glutamine synthetase family protein [Coriobacteriia bacterium]|nr:glutamine synthetase family protein [Coriobacteriia bacterium]MDO9108834.1 glutamine synthetase family protein [Coriobacteriia bacterium]
MPKHLRDGAVAAIKDKDIEFVHLWFTDVLGFLKTFVITADELENAMAEGMGFDGSSIEGFARIEESDMIALPDPTTLKIMPWRQDEQLVATMFCNIVRPEGGPFEGDPRYVLQRMLAKAAEMGFTFNVGPELEYYYFKDDVSTEVLDRASYFDMTTRDVAVDLRKKTVRMLKAFGITVEYSHHEVGPSQHEIDLRYGEALAMADAVMTYRLVVKEVAQMNGVYATFMPKPMYGEAGSGMHVHQSLFKGDSNAFYDPSDEFHLSAIAKSYIAGLLHHAPAFTAITNQWVNSYKRLVSGYEAPVHICWAHRNRSALVRVPMYKPGKEKATRIELRSPDPACNPYLAFAVMLAAGLDGIEKGMTLPDDVVEDVYEMSDARRAELGIGRLPGDLDEAIREMEKSELVREALGDKVFEYFLRNKKAEWHDYHTRVTPFELEEYLPLL